MRRTVFALTAIVLVAAATGCSMCAHPYDYCGPMFTGGNCEACNPDARAGSILSPPIQMMAEEGMVSPEEYGPPMEEEIAPSDYFSQDSAEPPAASNRVTAGTRVMWR